VVCNNGEERDSTADLYSAVIYLTILRTILAIVIIDDFEYKVFNIIAMFFNTIVLKNINMFVKQLKGFKDKTKRIYRLYKTLYNFKKSSR